MRRKTRQIRVGNVKIGGTAPVSIQSMTKVPTADVRAVVSQVKRLEDAGCEIVRFAVKSLEDARAIRAIKRKVAMPVVADIHFNYRLALESINSGADKIRLNPGNIRKPDEIKAVVKAAKSARIPIRIGVNSGSVLTGKQRKNNAAGAFGPSSRNEAVDRLVDSASSYIKLFERLDFHDIIVSLKASDVASMVDAYRRMSKAYDYPLHLGVTAAGSSDSGVVKSAIGIGTLLLDGIGDTIRVSLTADPVEEVAAAKRILEAVGARSFGPQIISCPTCGRCQVDLSRIVRDLENTLRNTQYARRNTEQPLSIAVMGCEVNGPGEAKEADIGIAFGKDSGTLFRGGKAIKRVSEGRVIAELIKEIKKLK